MDFLDHWADLLESGTKVDYTNVLSDNFKNNIKDAPTYDNSLGNITCENKYNSQAALSYFEKYIYPREIISESSYFTAKSTAESKENLKRMYFQSWARFVYGPSQEEQRSDNAFDYKVGVFLGFIMSPAKVAFDCVEGIQNGALTKIPGMLLFLAKASVSREYAFALYKLIGDAIDEWKAEYGEADAFNKGRMIGDLICQVLMTAEAGVKTVDGIKSLIESGKIRDAFKNGIKAVLKLRFKPGYAEHLKNVIKFDRDASKGITGGHNMDEFMKYFREVEGLADKDFIESITPHPSYKGIYEIKYKVPIKDNKGNVLSGQYKIFKNPKTVYDPSIISDSQMLKWGEEAMKDGIIKNMIEGNKITGVASNGLKFQGYINREVTDAIEVTNFYPVVP